MNTRLLLMMIVASTLVAAGCDKEAPSKAPNKVGPAPKAARPAPAKPTVAETPPATDQPAAKPTKPEGRPATVTTTPPPATAKTPPVAAKPATPAPPAKPTTPAATIDKMLQPPAKGQPIPAPSDVAAPNTKAQKTASGLAYFVHRKGKGTTHPKATDTVEVHYTGWQTDGKMFDSSVARGETIRFPLTGVIPGWTEGVQLMKAGDITRFWIPQSLAYGGKPGAPAGMLVFDVELVQVVQPPKPPADVAAAPKDATKTASGLMYKVVTKGKGTAKPTATSVVEIHFTAWLPDGKLLDSSRTRGQSIKAPLGQTPPGWKEGIALMVAGQKNVFWMSEELASTGRPGGPKGMIVFEIELVSIVK